MRNPFMSVLILSLALSSASVSLQAQEEPESIYGYIAWTDPGTKQKHIVYGRTSLTDPTKVDVDYNPFVRLTFTGVGANSRARSENVGIGEAVHLGLTPEYGEWVDKDGVVAPPRSESRVAFRYQVNFLFDLSIPASQPPIVSDRKTIRYNPEFWHFSHIVATNSYSTIYSAPIVDPSSFVSPTIPNPGDHAFMRPEREKPFDDLPDFNR